MDTASCPRCHQPINPQAINCPHCGYTLKAYGHPGIPLHRATGDDYLCSSCTYEKDDSCNFPQRPLAKECILYQNEAESQLELQQQQLNNSFASKLKNWVNRNQSFLLIVTLLFVCLLIVLLRR
ncbi:zinc ribbon domain-containing protein [Calothrix sp. 336/3]|uniref:zinc ribbon domain-containing protein n=1 Tax=Calothrix sp. 336/3 TaxID=1337936 RepID=UPI0004E34A97|nr:zinc ribbon domain-containing protein [Calothrix sp. 336/3]AKG21689.1 hypothetical protein IJ00_10855 [Calothrix sp. 336/3]